MGARDNPTGILVVDKPAGPSSMAVVATVRRQAGGARTGHAGTLDPLATGVLVLALGRATKAIDRFMATDKRYLTTIDLSAFTATDDLEGELEPVPVAQPPDITQVSATLERFVGLIEQQPPIFSAVKIQGRRAYQLARRGIAAEIPSRQVRIYGIQMLDYRWPLAQLDVHCAKGVYIRRLARDLGTALGTGGHCTAIRRTAVGPFTIEMATPLDQVPRPLTAEHLLDVETALEMITPSD